MSRQRTLPRDETEALFEQDSPRRAGRWVLIAIAVLIAVGAIALAAILARRETLPLAELRVREKAVSVQSNRAEPRAGAEGEDLVEGDVVATDASGQAQIDFSEGSLLRLDKSSTVVLRDLGDATSEDEPRSISVDLDRGRIWNRIAQLASTNDAYEVRMENGVASVRGTTFLADCRPESSCYVVGVEDETEVKANSGETAVVGEGDCVEVATGGLDPCDEKKLGLMDEWVRQNLAEDEFLLTAPTVEPTSTPEEEEAGAPVVRRQRSTGGGGGGAPVRRAPAPPPAATAAPSATPKATEKPEPKDTPKPEDTPQPKDTPKPMPRETPTESDPSE